MAYFNRLPTVKYNNRDSIDLHRKLVLSKPINRDWFTSYDLQDGETLHDVSYNLYNTTDYWWIISLINNYDSVHYDMFIKDDSLQNLARQLQMVKLNDIKEYILFPPKCDIEYEREGKTYTAKVIRKFPFKVQGQEADYLIDVLLDDIDHILPENVNIKIVDSRLVKVSVYSGNNYRNGDIVRQNLTVDGVLEEFARGIIIYKEGNDLYIDKTKGIDFVETGRNYYLNDKLVMGQELVNTKLLNPDFGVTFSGISDVENKDTFEFNEFGLQRLYFLYRYDNFVEVNDRRQKLIVIKPQYMNVLQNNLVILED